MEIGKQSTDLSRPDVRRYEEITSSQRIIRNKIRGIAESVVMLEGYMIEASNDEALGLTRIINADLDVLETFFEEELGRKEREASHQTNREGLQTR